MKQIRLSLFFAFSLIATWFGLLTLSSTPVSGRVLAAPYTEPSFSANGAAQRAIPLAVSMALSLAVPNLNEVTGAVYDDNTGKLLLVGRHDPERPALNLDDLAIALRIIYEGEAPAVSIDPIPTDTSAMQVTYFGGIEQTHLGWTLFEADRLLKIYSMGRDNLTGQPVTSTVSGYQNVLQRTKPEQSSSKTPVWFRMWFEPLTTTQTIVKASSDHRAILFDQTQLTVKTEYINNPNSSASNPAAEEFVKHFNEHLGEFAKERPVLYQLASVQRFLLIARWLRDEGIPINLSWLADYPVTPTETPATTPRIGVSQTITPYIFFLEGGVDLTQENRYTDNDPTANQLKDAAAIYFSISGIQLISLALPGSRWDRATAFPIRGDYTLRYLDEYGNTWIFDAVRRHPLSFISNSFIANLETERSSSGKLKRITFADNLTVLIEHDAQGQLISLVFDRYGANSADLLHGFLGVFDNNLPVPDSVLPFKQFFATAFASVRLGQPTPHLRTQLGVTLLTLRGYPASYVFEQEQKLVIMRGLEQRTFDELNINSLYSLLRTNPNAALLAPVRAYLFPEGEQRLVLVSGPPLPSDPTLMHKINYEFSKLAGTKIPNLYLDDDPSIAYANLQHRQPLTDSQGHWNLAVMIDAPSFLFTQTAQLSVIQSMVTAAKLPLCTSWLDATCQQANILFLTRRSTDELLTPSPDAAYPSLLDAAKNDQLRGRHVGLFAVDRDEERPYVRQFVAEYGAIGVTTYDGIASLETLQSIVDEFIKQARSGAAPQYLDTVFVDAVCNGPIQTDITAAQLDDVCKLGIPKTQISMQPSSVNVPNTFTPQASRQV